MSLTHKEMVKAATDLVAALKKAGLTGRFTVPKNCQEAARWWGYGAASTIFSGTLESGVREIRVASTGSVVITFAFDSRTAPTTFPGRAGNAYDFEKIAATAIAKGKEALQAIKAERDRKHRKEIARDKMEALVAEHRSLIGEKLGDSGSVAVQVEAYAVKLTLDEVSFKKLCTLLEAS